MLKDLFKKEEPKLSKEEQEIATINKQIAELTPENRDLAEKEHKLHSRAIHAEPLDKDPIIKQRTETSMALSQVKGKIKALEEKKALPETILFIKERLDDFVVYVNGNRVKIPDSLEVKIPYTCGKHSITIPLYEVLRIQTTLETNKQLYNQWRCMLTANTTFQRGLLCQECVKEKREKLEKTHLYQSNKPLGQARIEIKVI